MKSYRLYWIEDEIADYFYGRERSFFNLFLDGTRCSGELKEIINKQIHYVTKPIPFLPFNRSIAQALANRRDYIQQDNKYYIESPCGNNTAVIEVLDNMIGVELTGHSDWEAYIFELLRKLDGRLLAIDLNNEQFGWLKPIKVRKYV
ncbi:sporulation inhibitor of replication protein SirA [Bacillus sp. AK031]